MENWRLVVPRQDIAQPPPALEEEWFVSIAGDQSGPFSLADAQRGQFKRRLIHRISRRICA